MYTRISAIGNLGKPLLELEHRLVDHVGNHRAVPSDNGIVFFLIEARVGTVEIHQLQSGLEILLCRISAYRCAACVDSCAYRYVFARQHLAQIRIGEFGYSLFCRIQPVNIHGSGFLIRNERQTAVHVEPHDYLVLVFGRRPYNDIDTVLQCPDGSSEYPFRSLLDFRAFQCGSIHKRLVHYDIFVRLDVRSLDLRHCCEELLGSRMHEAFPFRGLVYYRKVFFRNHFWSQLTYDLGIERTQNCIHYLILDLRVHIWIVEEEIVDV